MNIINSAIVTTKHDTLWADVDDLPGLTPKPVLVISAAYTQGSPEEAQLRKMLEACKLGPGLYNIVLLKDGEQKAWYRLRELLQPKVIFLIGVLPAQLGVSALFVLNKANHFNDRIWLPTVSVKELEQNITLKTQLWNNGMKPIFVEQKYISLP